MNLGCKGRGTVVPDHIVHLARWVIAVLVRVEDGGFAEDSRETAEGAETGWPAADDEDIKVGLGDAGAEGRPCEGEGEGEELGEEHCDGDVYQRTR